MDRFDEQVRALFPLETRPDGDGVDAYVVTHKGEPVHWIGTVGGLARDAAEKYAATERAVLAALLRQAAANAEPLQREVARLAALLAPAHAGGEAADFTDAEIDECTAHANASARLHPSDEDREWARLELQSPTPGLSEWTRALRRKAAEIRARRKPAPFHYAIMTDIGQIGCTVDGGEENRLRIAREDEAHLVLIDPAKCATCIELGCVPAPSPVPGDAAGAPDFREEAIRLQARIDGKPIESVRSVIETGGEVADDVAAIRAALTAAYQRGIAARSAPLDEATRMEIAHELTLAMYLYAGHKIDSRGPTGCIYEALRLAAPAVAADLDETMDYGTTRTRFWDDGKLRPGKGSGVVAQSSLREEPAPIDILLFCPACGTEHVDAPEPGTDWMNPPHKSHLCHGCGLVWRPADVPTNGVAATATRGSRDTYKPDERKSREPAPAGVLAVVTAADLDKAIDSVRNAAELLDAHGDGHELDDVDRLLSRIAATVGGSR